MLATFRYIQPNESNSNEKDKEHTAATLTYARAGTLIVTDLRRTWDGPRANAAAVSLCAVDELHTTTVHIHA